MNSKCSGQSCLHSCSISSDQQYSIFLNMIFRSACLFLKISYVYSCMGTPFGFNGSYVKESSCFLWSKQYSHRQGIHFSSCPINRQLLNDFQSLKLPFESIDSDRAYLPVGDICCGRGWSRSSPRRVIRLFATSLPFCYQKSIKI